MTRAEEERRQAHARKWKRASAIRDRYWTEGDFESEDQRLAEEVAALVAAGAIVRCPTMYAAGATSSTLFDI